MKVIKFMTLVCFGALLIFGSLGLPYRGDANAPLNSEKSAAGSDNAASYYIQNAYKDAKTPNMVTVVLADYRAYDTLGEEIVILTAGLICYLLLRNLKRKDDKN